VTYEEAAIVESGHRTGSGRTAQEQKRAKVSEAVLPEGQRPRLRTPDVATFPKQGRIPFPQIMPSVRVATRSGLGGQSVRELCVMC